VSTTDLVQKKMVYQYLCTYAQAKSDIAILCINTLQKDCNDKDPVVRGLALRSLCSLRVPNICEYALTPLQASLTHPSAYVRKTAVMCCAKLFAQDPSAIRETSIVDMLYNMLRDRDTQVVANAICALNEILRSEGGMAVNELLMKYLFNRLHEFPEWGQCVVLNVALKYKPQNEDEMFDIMNLLEDRLKHANSAVVMAATKVFLHVTEENPDLQLEVLRRLKAPMLTLMTTSSSELAYVIICHFKVLIQRAPSVYADCFKNFYCLYNDPQCVKLLKMEILTLLSTPENAAQIIAELAEYVPGDVDVTRAAITAIGKIASAVPSCVETATDTLLSFLDLNIDFVSAQTVVACRDVLRKYPERHIDVLPVLNKVLKDINESSGKAAVIWMIGEFGESIPDGPYILEGLVDTWADEADSEFRLELVTAAAKLFFKRAPEMQKILGRVLSLAVKDVNDVDVRDRGLLYYRLLQADVREAARVINSHRQNTTAQFSEAVDDLAVEAVFKEFNSLSVVYNLPESRFCKVKLPEEDEESKPEAEVKASDDKNAPLSDQGSDVAKFATQMSAAAAAVAAAHATVAAATGSAAPATPSAVPPSSSSTNILGDLLGGTSISSPAQPSLQLAVTPTIDKALFQSIWMPLEAHPINLTLSSPAVAQSIDSLLAEKRIYTMATGPGADANSKRYFMFAADASYSANPGATCSHPSQAYFLMEVRVNHVSGDLTASVKTQSGDKAEAFCSLLTETLKNLRTTSILPF